MNIKQFNCIPEKLYSSKITPEQAINLLTIFFKDNIPIFNISNYEEDYISEMIILILTKGQSIISSYNPLHGEFFNYFYSVIKNIDTTCRRKKCRYIIQEEHNLYENISNIKESTEKYCPSPKEPFLGKIPYRYEPINVKAFKQACDYSKVKLKRYFEQEDEIGLELKEKLKKINPAKLKKMILTITLKSSFYLDDNIIDKISFLCNFDRNDLAQKVQTLKSDLFKREKNKKTLEERRNKAYYHHQKYEKQMQWLKDNPDDYDEYKYWELEKKYLKHTQLWISLNKKLKDGVINIRPTNKAIADVLGICERQVSYYIKSIKELGI